MTPLPWPRRRNQQQGATPSPTLNEAPRQHRYGARQPDAGTRQVRAGRDSVAAGGNIEGSALGPNSTVTNIGEQHIHPESGEPLTWPVVVGQVPQLASAFQPRAEVRARVDAARRAGGAVVLTQVLAGGGGVGKTQLAASYAAEALHDGADLVVWVPAGEEQQIVTGYAQAAVRVRASGAGGEDPVADAKAFLTWLATTKRSWLVVLDDISDPCAVQAWWPSGHTGAGWALATTRLHDARLTGGGRRRVDVDVYTPDEALGYLRARLEGDSVGHLFDEQGGALARSLGYLPLAIGHAAAYMINQQETSTRYLQRVSDQNNRLDQLLPADADTEGYGRQTAATLLLALDAADRAEPAGLATPMLQLAALLDPAGHPIDLWNTPAPRAYLTDQQPTNRRRYFRPGPNRHDEVLTQDHVEAVLRTLHRYALLNIDVTAGPRAVRIHALTARAARNSTPEQARPGTTKVVADALAQAWPAGEHTSPDLCAVLRANTDALAVYASDLLWRPDAHPVLYRAGKSLLDAGLYASALDRWQRLAADAERLLGGQHASTLTARYNTARCYRRLGRTTEAIDLLEQVIADRRLLLGDHHTDTLTARNNLAVAYRQAGRIEESIEALERVLAERKRLGQEDHSATRDARNSLAVSYREAGRNNEAIHLLEQVVADRERLLDPDHPATLTARNNLARSYRLVGRTAEAISLLERVVADRARLLGDQHPHTIVARNSLAPCYRDAGRADEAMVLLEGVVADRERLLGPDHPDTLTGRSKLAVAYRQVGRTAESISLLEQVVVDRERLLGPDHRDSLIARANLANSHAEVGHTAEAIAIRERVLADRERLLGPEHPDTLLARGNLAGSYREAGRTTEALDLQEQVLALYEQLYGADHPDTLAKRRVLHDWRTEQSASDQAADETGLGHAPASDGDS